MLSSLWFQLLAMTVLGVCGWTLANTLKNNEIETIDFTNSDVTSNFTTYENFTEKTDDNIKPNFGENSKGLNTGITRRYKMLIQISIGGSLIATLFQLIVSIILLGSSVKVSSK
jgi:hypothetical protein